MGIKPTAAEVEARTDFVEEMLVQGYRTSQIKRAFRAKYGEVAWNTVLNYIDRARKRFSEAAVKDPETRREELITMAQAVLVDKRSTPRDKVNTLNLLADLAGAKRGSKIELTGANGGPLKVANATEQLTEEQLRRIVDMAEPIPIRNGNGHHIGTVANGESNGDGGTGSPSAN